MTNSELVILLAQSMAQSRAIEAKYRSGIPLTRSDCNALRKATQRIGICAREVWIQRGKPPGFPELEKPIKLSPLPKSMQSGDDSKKKEPLDLTGAMPEGGDLN